jgi:hypothetical protein
MRQSFTERHREMLCVLFFLFESLLIVSWVIGFSTDRRNAPVVSEGAGVTFLFSLVGLLAVSLIIRRAWPRLALVGWISVFVGFWSAALSPVL